ncbi:TIGR03854 family LLM class F420-dependent oxidoreductase [Frankia sp. CNm7]|uniref:TIGR03854 family LLM class F420-dependent oxidoreductase n=1 Tax=Frankia nepalensis TaxID=1836974 RepID=A0A937RA31_9ACTN|nr:TIGR03854 family LLM class F420-dependent oxidoreductase [Frankia nepalensis]MBL7494811.1 TIGR03854 family LLM class F420-dependent oxidoreductase [Frankia nepalensis]MBL7514108.1 TIGR03854 family LLM class F420-dependent oxidoreductase [Frankia nepalensis]MBL7524769.1 TIGR03854 family LLM class F420-dependent oxidoreductase [Frankia nepalensis]MBL7626512.1 TIGR03854 family LLM class F420-dependent oxidoreductase [Frankia nepalensis]
MKVRIGVGFAGVPGEALSGLVKKVAQLDIDSLWFSEQVSMATVDPMVGMSWALARTNRLKVGTGVAVLPGRNPALFAKQLASLASLAPGRVLPVVGLGPARAAERSAFPVPPGRRGAVFDEALTVVRRLLSEESVTHDGEFFQLDAIGIGERPARPLDLWLGGATPVALRRIGRLGDGWLASLVTPAEAAAGIDAINTAAAEAGRAVDQEHFGLSLRVAFKEPPAAQLAAIQARRPDADPGVFVPVGWDAARAVIADFVAAGVSKFVIYPAVPPEGLPAFLDAFVPELTPLQT